MTRALVAAACVLWLATAQADPARGGPSDQAVAVEPATLLAGLDTDDPVALAAAVTAIERAPSTPELADTLFAAGRACEDRLHDPARALAIYERVVRDMPDAGVSIAASRRIAMLKDVRGHAREASELATLMDNADLLPREDIVRRTEVLIAASWPGAVDAALWLADWQCRTRHFGDAQALYRRVVQQWPGTEPATLAPRNAAGCALDAHDWDLARELAANLAASDPADAAVRDALLAAATRGHDRAQLYNASWIGLVVALVALLASLAEAMFRGGLRRPRLRPPVEVLFLAPITVVISIGSLLTDSAIGQTVLAISVGGLTFAWISGVALDLLRARDRAVRTRALVHVILCAVGVLAVGYITITRDGLLDMLAETVRFGPGS